MLGGAVFAQFFLLTLYMQQVLHYSALKTGVAYIGLTLTIIVFSGVAQALVNRVGVRWVLPVGMALSTVALVLFAQLPVHGALLRATCSRPFIIGGLGLALAFVPMSIGALTGVRPRRRRRRLGADQHHPAGRRRDRRRDRDDDRDDVHGALRQRPRRVRARSAAPRSRTASRPPSTCSPASPPPARCSPRSCSSQRPRNTARPSRSQTKAHPRHSPQPNLGTPRSGQSRCLYPTHQSCRPDHSGSGRPRGEAAATGPPVVERTSQSARHRAWCPARSQTRRGASAPTRQRTRVASEPEVEPLESCAAFRGSDDP